MELSGDYLFDAPQSLVWQSLLDPNVLGQVMPGGKGFQQIGENQYDGVLEVKVGPVQGTFQGKITLSDIVPPEHYKIEVDGKGAPGFVKANGSLHLETRESQTFMTYSGAAQVGGRIASVGQRLLDSAARSIVRQSLEALNEYLKVQVAQQTPPVVEVTRIPAAVADVPQPTVTLSHTVSIPEYQPPSQTTLALKVARDVLNDFVPAKYQPYLLGVVIGIVLLLIWVLLSR
jgi:carbon monoxide dehydrogenase subunit G